MIAYGGQSDTDNASIVIVNASTLDVIIIIPTAFKQIEELDFDPNGNSILVCG